MLKGQIRHTSKHAAGVVVVPGNIYDQIPLMKHKNELITAWVDGIYRKDLQNLGFIKFDVLGLKTLTVIKKTLELIKQTGSYKENRGNVDLEKINWNLNVLELNDSKLYTEFSKANTNSVFQFKSDGMKSLLRYLQPTKFDDINAATALFRPGPKNAGMDLEFCKRKKAGTWQNKFPGLDEIFKDTYGVIVFQEQVMQVGHEIAGFTLDETDDLRKALVKRTRDKKAAGKIKDKVEIMREKFIKGCMKNEKYKYTKELAKELYENLCSFNKYGFNKCIYKLSQVFIIENNLIKPISIEHLYEKQKQNENDLYTVSYDFLKNKIIINKIKNVFKSGKKMLYRVKTKSGKIIITTKDHKYMNKNGEFKKLSELNVNDKIKVVKCII
jgi:DNA polymerase-3 subunit alpha